jgi:dihydrolipoamide dehydrogenase
MADSFDIVVLGAGPGGYVAAIRAAQLGKKVAIIEKEHLGGVCLNKGCIPTKAVLKSAHSVHEIADFKDLGINVDLKSLDGSQAVKRAKKISTKISQGVGYLMKKNKIKVYDGHGEFVDKNTIKVGKDQVKFTSCIIATGAKYRSFPGLEHNGKNLIGAWEAIKMEDLPKSIGIIGAGAIGVEFAYFWNAFGVDVHIFELQKHLLPIEDEDSSKEVERAYKKLGIKMSLGVEKVETKDNGKDITITAVEKGKKVEYKFDKGLIAVGMTGILEGYGLEKVGVKTDRGFIAVNDMYQTNIPHIYAIGDVAGPPLLAHAASHEGVIAAEHIAGEKPHKLDKLNIAGCTYCQPQVASVGYTERAVKELGVKYSVGKLPFQANGKAIASNETAGFVKTILGEHGELLGAHIVGTHATELIHEYALFRTMEGIDEEIFATVHPHPTLGEWLAESVMAAKNRALNF